MGFLSHLRVVDLTDERGMLAAHMLAKLGADVLQIEAPGAKISPYFRAAYGGGKRRITLDLDAPAGRDEVLRLLEGADILFESAEPGAMARRGLDFDRLAQRFPRLIYVSITAFGLRGPKTGYAATELIAWAAAGPLLLTRNGPDDAPLRVTVPQAFFHAAADAAGAALIAMFARKQTGRGQHIDVSAQASAAQATMSSVLAMAVGHENYSFRPVFKSAKKPTLDLSGSGSRTRRTKWQVKDGLVELHLAMGPASGRFTNNLFAWLHEVGAIDDRAAAWDWVEMPKAIETDAITHEDIDAVRDVIAAFFLTCTKDELTKKAIERKLLVAPVMNIADLVASEQFAARTVFEETETEGRRHLLPGRFAVMETSPASAPGEAAHGAAGPLASLRVADLAWVVAGPLVGRNLADFGATVVRVDSSKRIETARVMGPFPNGKFDVQQSTLYENCNAGKLGLALDLASPEGQSVVRDLVKWSGVVIESFSPGQMKKWGLGYEELRKLRPDLIMLSTSLMGQSGPQRGLAGFGNIGAAFSGFQNLVGLRGETPVGPFGPYTDFVAPRFSLVALLAALDHRERTGEGCWIDVSQVETGVQLLAAEIAEYTATGVMAVADGNRDRAMAPHGVFRTAGEDSWIAIAARDDDDWQRLAALIGGETLAHEERFRTFTGRKAHETELEAILTAWTSPRVGAEIETLLQAHGVPAHVAVNSAQFVSDPQLLARGHLLRLPHSLMGEAVVEATRFVLSDTPGRPPRSAATFGRDNHHVLHDLLGYDDARIDSLEKAGVLK